MHTLFNITELLGLFFLVFYVSDTNARTIFYKTISEDEAAKSLNKINSNEVLPLISFLRGNSESNKLSRIDNLDTVYIHLGRLINGTKFTSSLFEGGQLFFCPEENSEKKCLISQQFQGLERLQCSKQAEPVILFDFMNNFGFCGLNETGVPYLVAYEICSGQHPFTKDRNQFIPIYAICYDEDKHRTLFASHIISFPQLLSSEVLSQERNIKYDMPSSDRVMPRNYQTLKAAMNEDESNSPSGSLYKVQKLVHADDMAFALWRKPTFKYVNVELQHKDLINLWNEINNYIRLDAIKNNIEYEINTGVFDIISKPRKDDQMSNTWIKLIHTTSQAVVILMNNFIDDNEEENEVDDYCEQDSCANQLKESYEKIKGRVLCCPFTKKMKELFGVGNINSTLPVLHIPGINKDTEQSN